MASLFATSGPTRTSPLEIRSTKPGTGKQKTTVWKSHEKSGNGTSGENLNCVILCLFQPWPTQFSVHSYHSFTAANLHSTHLVQQLIWIHELRDFATGLRDRASKRCMLLPLAPDVADDVLEPAAEQISCRRPGEDRAIHRWRLML